MVISSILNVLFFAIWVGVPTIAPEADEFLPRAFGTRPFGIPVQRLVFFVMCALYLPLIPAICGLMRLELLRGEMVKASNHQEWERFKALAVMQRPASRMAFFGLIYFMTLVAGWIVWTELHGL